MSFIANANISKELIARLSFKCEETLWPEFHH